MRAKSSRWNAVLGSARCLVAFGAMLALGCNAASAPDESDTGPPVEVDAGPPPPPPPGLVDDSGAIWTMLGAPDDDGEALVSVPGHNAFWFAWSVFHPGTLVYGDDTPIGGEITGEEECTVPCDQITPACGGRDCIPALTSPTMVPVGDAALSYLADGDLVLGVVTSEGPRAYPHNILWWHEIVNEDVGGQHFAVTLCPLTGSALAYDRDGFVDGATVELGVSGNLYNSNLVMYDRTSETLWSQMRLEAVFGSELGRPAPLLPVFEMTWRAWRSLHPDTVAVSVETGHVRDYLAYPYADYRTNHGNTFRPTDPPPDARFENKEMVFGVVVGGEVRAYPWASLVAEAGSNRGVVEDEVGGVPLAIVFDLHAQYVHAFDRRAADGSVRTIELQAAPEP